MAVDSKVSFVLSSFLTLLLFSGMQMYKNWLISSKLHIIFGGYLGSLVFMFLVTSIGNLEAVLFGKSFQMKLFPEVFLSLVCAMFSAGLIHRVAVTTCFLFSILTLYYLNRISQETYSVTAHAPVVNIHIKKKK